MSAAAASPASAQPASAKRQQEKRWRMEAQNELDGRLTDAGPVPRSSFADLQVQYTNYKNALQQIAQKIGDVEQEADEHKLVLETLEPLPADRKCFRMINGVLIERTVKDVIPALKTNAEGLSKVLDDLVKQYKSRQEDLEKWKVSARKGPGECHHRGSRPDS
ncbi:uncharacterized protein SPSK_03662 [Sporothrix schenckii 1099-18]|uniref:Prefoldin subunit 2 n=1 Tax=Sporothrix schenckii 1099-18 TaxID=1397361 RepID=A0A0F2M1D4_SPOSC|nr:uncharacterized protein SPSK_03662 [Sporothrix schenckii 1099-18]KJR82570.1 hypothetical protein SPSK_03662 [Sporothrix schenckii 1099-18]